MQLAVLADEALKKEFLEKGQSGYFEAYKEQILENINRQTKIFFETEQGQATQKIFWRTAILFIGSRKKDYGAQLAERVLPYRHLAAT